MRALPASGSPPTKRDSGRPHVPVGDLVDEALAHGWVDSRPRALDGERSQRLVTPRRPTSAWSRVNKRRVERLVTTGRMTPAGLAAIETAKRNGAWTALDEVGTLAEPDDLRAGLDADPVARRCWDAFPRSTKRAILEWIAAAKAPATRDKRVAETAAKAAVNVRANQWRQPKGARPPDRLSDCSGAVS
jgi:uncharacterized protein YdeI (YjbR/CyaY-like superfamily)